MRAPNLIGVVLAAGLWAAPALAQQPAPKGKAAPAPAAPIEVELKFEREVYSYPPERRRDPFTALVAKAGVGPRFEELVLKGVIASPVPGRSVALLADLGGKIYRVRQGDVVGNVRIVGVEGRRVLLSVNDFGLVRQEVLELRRQETEGV